MPLLYADVVRADGAIHYWRLNESGGTVAADTIGTVPGTISAAGVTFGQAGALADGTTAILFDGSVGKVETAAAIAALSAAITVECWVKFTGTPTAIPFVSTRGADAGGSANAFEVGWGGGQIRISIASGSPNLITWTAAINNGAWHHVVWTSDKVTTNVYIDGAVIRTIGQTWTAISNHKARIAYDASAFSRLAGSVDEVAIYPTALSAAQVANHYAARTVSSFVGRPAILNRARLNNFRLNYIPAALQPIRSSRVMVFLNGVLVRYRHNSITINDKLRDEPNTCSITFMPPTVPQPQQGVRIVVNANAPTLLFAGALETVNETYENNKRIVFYPSTAQDDTPRANRRIPLAYYDNISASTIASVLIGRFAPGFTANHIQADLPAITVRFDGSEANLNGCLRQMAKLVGGYFYFEDRDLHFFQDEPTEIPDPIDTTPGRFLNNPPIIETRDDSQIRTRVYGMGHQEATLSEVLVGDTIIPIDDATLFVPTGGKIISAWQVLGYTGVQLGGGGGLIGPGAAPGAAPVANLLPGTGVESGSHDYATTFLTATGESVAGPRVTIVVGNLAAPGIAPTIASLSAGGSMNVGVFDYAVTLVSATGETTPGPISTQVATGGPAAAPPQSAPALSGPIAGGSVTPGAHQYGVTFTGPYGETGIGPASQAIVAQGPMGAPPPPTGTFDKGGQELGPGTTYQYQTTYVTATGETTASGSSAPVTIDPVPNGGSPPVAPTPTVATGGAIPTGYFYEYAVSFLTAKGETDFVWNLTMTARLDPPNNAFLVTQLPTSSDPRVIGRKLYRRNASLGTGGLVATINDNSTTQYTDTAAAVGGLPAGNTTAWGRVVLSNIYPGGPATTARRIYRTQPGQPPGTFYLLATINNNTATSYTDTTPNVSAGQNPPGTDTTGARTIQVSGIATGPAGTTGRNLYRTPANSSTLKLLGTIANNSTTSLTDTLDDSALGATAPSGATLNTVNLSGIALGGPMVLQRKLYRRFNGAGPFKLVTTIGNNTSTTYQDTASNAALGAAAPTTNTAAAGQVAVSQIPIGGAGVTGRKLYRTAVGSQQLRFVATLGDNVASTYTDVTSDFNLGANAPVNDTSGLQQPDGQVSAGATSLIVAGISAFSATGGWAILGNGQQIIRYTGVSATSLTGIPASGTGSLKATVSYNANITAAPALTGVSGLAMTLAPNLGLLKGDPIAIWIQRDDVAAQNELAAREGGGDGIIEHRIVDQRRGEPSLQALCDADLAQYARSLVTVTYACRDVKTKSGKPIVIDIPSPLIQETLTIQDVVITELDIVPGLQPKFAVTASSIRFTLEDLLRRMASTLEGI